MTQNLTNNCTRHIQSERATKALAAVFGVGRLHEGPFLKWKCSQNFRLHGHYNSFMSEEEQTLLGGCQCWSFSSVLQRTWAGSSHLQKNWRTPFAWQSWWLRSCSRTRSTTPRSVHTYRQRHANDAHVHWHTWADAQTTTKTCGRIHMYPNTLKNTCTQTSMC